MSRGKNNKFTSRNIQAFAYKKNLIKDKNSPRIKVEVIEVDMLNGQGIKFPIPCIWMHIDICLSSNNTIVINLCSVCTQEYFFHERLSFLIPLSTRSFIHYIHKDWSLVTVNLAHFYILIMWVNHYSSSLK